jgi:hypothetical protein
MYAEIFKGLPDHLKKICDIIASESNFQLNLNDICDVEIVKYARDLSVLISCVKRCLDVLRDLCPGCNCDHDIWCVAGGSAAHLMGKTSTYNDIDLYVSCDGMLKHSYGRAFYCCWFGLCSSNHSCKFSF